LRALLRLGRVFLLPDQLAVIVLEIAPIWVFKNGLYGLNGKHGHKL